MTTSPFRILAAAFGSALLLACTSSSTGPEPLDAEAIYLGEYAVAGDRLILHPPSDTDWICDGDVPTPEVWEREPDTSTFSIDGDILRLYSFQDTVFSESLGYAPVAVVQHSIRMARVSGGRGLEGRWQIQDFAYEVVSGTLEGEDKAQKDRDLEYQRTRLQYITIEYEFAGDHAWGRMGGDFAGQYLAQWNGEFDYDDLDSPDSAEFDIRVVKVNDGTLRMTGGKTGETVTVTFTGPFGSEHYASDNPDHPAYDHQDFFRLCDVEDWIHDFMEENRKAGPLLQPGLGKRGIWPEMAEKPSIWPFFKPSARLPLNRLQSLLN